VSRLLQAEQLEPPAVSAVAPAESDTSALAQAAGRQVDTSIRRSLLTRLSVPLLALALAGSGATYFVAQYFSQHVLDQWLYDSAIALANQIRSVDGNARLDLPRPALDILEWDSVDRFYYQVSSSRQGELLSNANLPNPPVAPKPRGEPVYFDARVGSDSLRMAAIALRLPSGEMLLVKVAETRHKRNEQAAQVLSATLLLSLALVIASASLVWFAVGSGMRSLENAIRRIRLQSSKSGHALPLGDVSVPREVRPLVDEIRLLLEQLTASHRANQRFVGNTAHQLRTPIAALRVQLELARRQQDIAQYRKALDHAVPELARLTRLLHQLLTLARIDEDHSELLKLGPVDLDALAREEVERRIDEALARGVDLGYAGPGKPVPVAGKDALLREVVVNLLDNALRYSTGPNRVGSGSPALVTIGVCADPPELYVEDQGPGIPMNERELVRERYYRIAGSGADGSGLGLAIVEEIAHRHDARFLLETGPNGDGLKARFLFTVR
jgi:two-component system sensor histidine kinase TctE